MCSLKQHVRRKWEKEQMALFISDKNASLLSYNPLGGIFVQRLGQNLSYARAKDDMDVLDLVMRETLAAADFANKESFRLVNKNVPVYIIADRFEDYFKLPSLQPRFADLPINNGLIEDVDDEDYRYFIIPITALYEAMFPSGISSPKLQFMQLYSANVIPQDVTQSSRRVMLRKVIKKWAQVAAITGVAVIGVEAAGSVYFSSASIPDALQREHTVAMTKQGEVNNELERIKQQHLEDENVIGALNSVVMSKPDGLGFTEISYIINTSNRFDKRKATHMKLGIDRNALKANIHAIEAQIKSLPRPHNDLEWMDGFAKKDTLDTKILDLIFDASDFSLRKNGRMQFNYTMAYVINYHSTGGWLAVLDEFEHVEGMVIDLLENAIGEDDLLDRRVSDEDLPDYA